MMQDKFFDFFGDQVADSEIEALKWFSITTKHQVDDLQAWDNIY